jgi:oxalate decarboxylase
MKKSSTHVVSLTGQEPSLQVAGGSITHVDASVFPILERLSIRRLLLEAGGVREPHWHANCHELTYCVRGEALVTIFDNQSARNSFGVGAGEMFFAPSGARCITSRTPERPRRSSSSPSRTSGRRTSGCPARSAP